MADPIQLTGAPITINADDGSSKVYDAGLLVPEAQQAVVMLAFINQFRQILNTSSQVYSSVVNNNLVEEALVEEVAVETEDEVDDTVKKDTKK
tara:strand:+ start:443 stop:721 length:279 start_codon:yes stop_codon:yes gene_type:complete